MPAHIGNLKDENGDTFYPVTKTSAVLDANNVDVETKISSIETQVTPTQWQNATLNSTYVSGGTCRYCTIGKLVIVQIYDIRFTQTAVNNFSSSNNLIAISGLPNGDAHLINLGSGGGNRLVTLQCSGGNMTNWWCAVNSTSDYYHANFVYVKEN